MLRKCVVDRRRSWHASGTPDRMTNMIDVEVPQYHELLWPALLAVMELGGSSSIGEMTETGYTAAGDNDLASVTLSRERTTP
jgi:hypothetical protein